MKNKISDLRDHMFAQLERLADETLTPEQIKDEIERSKAISEIGKVIVESAKTEVLHLKLTNRLSEEPPKFLESRGDNVIKIDRPKAEYSNSGHIQVKEKYADQPTA